MNPAEKNAGSPEQNTASDGDFRAFSHIQHTLGYHERLLTDRQRNQTFYRAIKKHVTTGTRVLDIGSGTGVWAIVAARLGASKVVAIEKEQILQPIIEKLAAKNGVKDRIEVLVGDSREVKISGRFDVIITETVGNQGFDEQIVPIIIDARTRFLKRGGVVIPREIALVATPAKLKDETAPLPSGLDLDYRFLEALNLDIPKKITEEGKFEVLAPTKPLVTLDLMSAKAAPELREMKCKWRLTDASRLDCLVVSAEVLLTKGVSLHTIGHTRGWNPLCLPLEPFEKGPAIIECTITISNKQYYWIVTHVKNGQRKVQSHSPVFPYTVVHSYMKRR